MISQLTLRPGEHRGWSYHQDGETEKQQFSYLQKEPRDDRDHYGDTIVRGRYDGDFDKTNLPGELILTNYFTVRGGKIVSLIVIRSTPASY